MHARGVLYNTLFLFSFQTLDHLPLTDPENFGTPVVQVNSIVKTPVIHVLDVFNFFLILSQLVHSPASNMATVSISAP